MAKKLFDFCVGNPPYNAEFNSQEGNTTYAAPVYNEFIDAAVAVADKVELIHPARFLFYAGSTPKAWNEKMLHDPHFKILNYHADATEVFPNTSITGGIAISYHDNDKDFGIIEFFSPFEEMRTILQKVKSHVDYKSIQNCISIQTRFNLGELYKEHPEAKEALGSGGKDSRFEKNIFKKVNVFTDVPTNDDDIRTLGISDGRQRVWKYIPKKYVDTSQENLMTYKTLSSVSNGAAGNLGNKAVRILGETVLAGPGDGYTRSFIGIGSFKTKDEAINCKKYLLTKFARVMVGILKTTQMLNPDVWKYVPLQDFTESSDIDWSKSVHEIDLQFYRKYGLSVEEINFIEAHVKEMI